MGNLFTSSFPFDSGIKSMKERRGEKNMRKYFTWCGLILCVSVLCVVEAGATVPFADDVVDIRLIRSGVGAPSTMSPAFDLDDYVIDNDTADDSVSWSVSVEGGGPTVNIDTTSAQLALHEAEVLAQAAAGIWSATFTADDSSDTADTASELKYSSFWLTEPKFTADNRLSIRSSGPRFTYVKLFDGSGAPEITPALSGSIDTGGGPGVTVEFGPLTMYDLTSGAPVRVDQGQSVSFGGLDAYVLTSSGQVALTPSGVLNCAVLISIPAVLQGSTFDRNGDWDGKVIMVAPASNTETFPGWTYGGESLAINTRFENIPGTAPLQPDGAGSSVSPLFIVPGWRATTVLGRTPATISIVSAAGLAGLGAGSPGDPANQFAGATSGNALKLAFPAAGTNGAIANLTTLRLSPVTPGEIYGLSLNLSTDIPSSQISTYRDKVKLVVSTYTRVDEGYFTAQVFEKAPTAGSSNPTVSLPMDGEWRQIYVEMRIPELSFALDNTYVGGTGTSNVSDDGVLTFVRLFVENGAPAFNAYIDNIYHYRKGMSDLNYADVNESSANGLIEQGLANGVTAMTAYNAISPTTNGNIVDGAFETATDLGGNNWRVLGAPGLVNVTTPTGAWSIANFGRLNTSGSLKGQVTGGTPATSTDNDGGRASTRPIGIRGQDSTDVAILDAGGNPVPNLAGEGYYGVSFWITSDAASCARNPQVKMAFQEQRPATNQAGAMMILGPSNVPAQPDGWYQYSAVGAFPQLTAYPAMQQALITFDIVAKGNRPGYPGAGDYTGTNVPGYDADAGIYIDDVQLHRVRDTQEYWNASLFE